MRRDVRVHMARPARTGTGWSSRRRRPSLRGAGQAPRVKMERPTGRTILAHGAWSARLAPGRWWRDGQTPTSATRQPRLGRGVHPGASRPPPEAPGIDSSFISNLHYQVGRAWAAGLRARASREAQDAAVRLGYGRLSMHRLRSRLGPWKSHGGTSRCHELRQVARSPGFSTRRAAPGRPPGAALPVRVRRPRLRGAPSP